MKPIEMLREAALLAFNAHYGQTDKAGKQYFMHPFRVSMNILDKTNDRELAAAAVLHDVIEDTSITLDDLANKGMSERIVETVDALTRRPKEEYIVYLARLSTNEDARKIKIADLLDNLREDRMSKLFAQTREELGAKYRAALYLLKKQD